MLVKLASLRFGSSSRDKHVYGMLFDRHFIAFLHDGAMIFIGANDVITPMIKVHGDLELTQQQREAVGRCTSFYFKSEVRASVRMLEEAGIIAVLEAEIKARQINIELARSKAGDAMHDTIAALSKKSPEQLRDMAVHAIETA